MRIKGRVYVILFFILFFAFCFPPPPQDSIFFSDEISVQYFGNLALTF